MEYPVYRNGCEVGTLYTEEKGVWTEASFRWKVIPDEVVKLWLDNGEERFLLGTPYPEGDELVFFRRISTAQWREMSKNRDCKVIILSGNVEHRQPEAKGQLSAKDGALQGLLEGTAYQVNRQNGRTWLSWRWKPGQVFPIPSLFCLTRYQNGQLLLQIEGDRPVVTGQTL